MCSTLHVYRPRAMSAFVVCLLVCTLHVCVRCLNWTWSLVPLSAVRKRREEEKAKAEEERKRRDEQLDAQQRKQREREQEIEEKQRRREEEAKQSMEERMARERERQRPEETSWRAPLQGSWRQEEKEEEPPPKWSGLLSPLFITSILSLVCLQA